MVVINFQSYLQPKPIKSLYNLGATEGCLSLFTRPHYYIAWKNSCFSTEIPQSTCSYQGSTSSGLKLNYQSHQNKTTTTKKNWADTCT